MYVADYVLMEYGTGAIMAVPAPRRARLRLRRGVRPADPARGRGATPTASDGLPYTGDGPLIVNSHPDFDGLHNREALHRDRRLARPRGQGPRLGQLPPARLAALAPALLGLPDPDHPLRRLRDRARARGPAARRAARRQDYKPKGRSPLAAAEDWVRAPCPACGAPRAARDRHDGHVRRLLLVLPALLRRAQRRRRLGPARSCASGCPSTSTSAASSTRSCTCSTRASSSRRWPTSGTSTCRSRSRGSSPRG